MSEGDLIENDSSNTNYGFIDRLTPRNTTKIGRWGRRVQKSGFCLKVHKVTDTFTPLFLNKKKIEPTFKRY